jgi:hypothetical protein
VPIAAKTKLKPGDTVRVVGERGTAKIKSILSGVHGALLETAIADFRNWNLDELRLVKRGNSRKSMSDAHRAKLTANWRRTKTK